jgi:hypothetical protein
MSIVLILVAALLAFFVVFFAGGALIGLLDLGLRALHVSSGTQHHLKA